MVAFFRSILVYISSKNAEAEVEGQETADVRIRVLLLLVEAPTSSSSLVASGLEQELQQVYMPAIANWLTGFWKYVFSSSKWAS